MGSAYIDRLCQVKSALALVVLFCLLSSPRALAAPADIGGLTVSLPDPASGWRKAGNGNLFMLQKDFPETEDDKRGSALIQITKPLSAARNSLPAGMKTFVATLPDMAKEDILIKHSGITINGHDIRVEERCCVHQKNVSINQIVVGIAGNRRQAYLQLVLLNLDGDRSQSAETDFEALVRSVKLDPSDKDFDLVPAGGDGGLDGVFTHLDTGVRPNVFGGVDFYSDSEITMFDPKGLFSTELPKGGRSIAEHCRENPTDCGLYKLTGGGFFSSAGSIEMRSVTSAYGTMETETKPFSKRGDDLVIDEDDHHAVPPFEDGATLDGEWVSTSASSGMSATSSGSVASSHTLTLHRNGTFERTGWSGAAMTNEIGGSRSGVTTSGNRPGASGRYTLSGYRLDLTDASGKTESMSIFEPDKGSDGLLVINGSNYLKEDGQ
ncbi:hypothetical protein Rleg4DRAFT_6602 [Rhizobium leguminosarum bv. trifolii WSM2297]|uniref:Uncharacterized protein n=1 Tax=Rhizobium leguminosarum bv. trifolii WSM2297 TaxID=754762 RepID=J0L3G4_RHILT|nr:hypothetical protein [Rhizobium leguminosarum]EJC83650.1 hypothetical protein Rleg4DRAFT_5419 [Rhizobium leguminosarum bv. trifolii WSM2297]EJC84759.1 hypothetical protein Rleg4DRAFT_6602 [Rhizobium leguminosarum bv. trifolii WSM2297]